LSENCGYEGTIREALSVAKRLKGAVKNVVRTTPGKARNLKISQGWKGEKVE